MKTSTDRVSIDPSFHHSRQKHMPRRRRTRDPIDTRASIGSRQSVFEPTRRSTHAAMYERLIHKSHFARFGPAGTLETVRKERSPRRSRIKQRRTRQEGRPLVLLLQNRDRRWLRAISRRRRRRSMIHPSNTPWIATRNVSTHFSYRLRPNINLV